MKTFEVSTESQSYKFLNRWCGDVPEDICSYVRRLVLYIVGLLCFGLAASTILWFATLPIQTLLASWYFGFLAPVMSESTFVIATIVDVAAILVWGSSWVVSYIARNRSYYKKEPGVIGLWWKSFKEKTCVKLEFKD